MDANELFDYAHIGFSQLSEEENNEHYLKYLCLSAKKRNPNAIYSLAMLFETGDMKIAVNQHIADRLLKLACKLNHPHAMWRIALSLLYKEQRIDQGKELLIRAAQAGSQGALWTLSEFYRKGLFGFRKNIRMSVFYRKRSGNPP